MASPAAGLGGLSFFGGVSIAQLHVQSFGIDIASQFLSMLPYLATILVLVIISRDQVKIRMNAPATIGKSFSSHLVIWCFCIFLKGCFLHEKST